MSLKLMNDFTIYLCITAAGQQLFQFSCFFICEQLHDFFVHYLARQQQGYNKTVFLIHYWAHGVAVAILSYIHVSFR